MSQSSRTTTSDSLNQIATIRIELRDSDPLIWRQVEVPIAITLKTLHEVIQAVMGWGDCHLWEFTIGMQRYSPPMDMDWETEPRGDVETVCLASMRSVSVRALRL